MVGYFKSCGIVICFPLSNGHLERVFPQIKLIKTNRRTCLNEDTLDDLIWINVEEQPFQVGFKQFT